MFSDDLNELGRVRFVPEIPGMLFNSHNTIPRHTGFQWFKDGQRIDNKNYAPGIVLFFAYAPASSNFIYHIWAKRGEELAYQNVCGDWEDTKKIAWDMVYKYPLDVVNGGIWLSDIEEELQDDIIDLCGDMSLLLRDGDCIIPYNVIAKWLNNNGIKF